MSEKRKELKAPKQPDETPDENKKVDVVVEEQRREIIPAFSRPGEVFDPNAPANGGAGSSRWSGIVYVVIAAALAIAVVLVLTPRLAPSLKAYRADITRLELDFVDVREDLGALEALPAGFTSLSNDVIGFGSTVTGNSEGIVALGDRVTSAESEIESLKTNPTPAGNSLVYTLTGTFGQYVLNVKSSIGGDFLARINLVYTTPQLVGELNATLSEATQTFHTGWLTSPNREYIPALKWDATIGNLKWRVTQVSFYTSKFTLVADTDTTLSIAATGLKTGVELAHLTYVEVFPLLTTTVAGGGGAA